MNDVNMHERELSTSAEQVGALIDSLASKHDALWPRHSWPRMELDGPLGVGATGGHGPIGYSVEEYSPGKSIKFRFTKAQGFKGIHRFDVIERTQSSVVLRHTIEMSTHGLARLTWPLMIRPMHDALFEDAWATAEASLGQEPQIRAWSLWVRVLRCIMSGGKVPRQVVPKKRMLRRADA